ncbi:MAG: glycoside hydrolase family 28 protein [Bacteroidales bacterium]|nr:glycoside hydrolase family 28 protein [Bacteroidales bacterium]
MTSILRKKIVLLMFFIGVANITLFATDYKSITNKEIKAYYKDLPFEMEMIQSPKFKKYSVRITDFGAMGDGVTLNTKAFEQAIKNVSEKGGGTVIVPEGIWLTGPITLLSNINLFTEQNAYVLFTPDFNQYPVIDAIFEGLSTKRCQSPISAKNATNIAITGYGIFDGSGDAWRPVKKEKMTEKEFKNLVRSGGVLSADKKTWFPSEASRRAQDMCVDQNVPVGPVTAEEWLAIRDFLRPVMVNFVQCKNILLEGVTFQNSPAWNLHPLMSENIILNKLTVRNPWYSQNGDGIDLESCKNTLIVNSSFDVGDDAICMKSGKNQEGRIRNMPTENVIVGNCVVYHGHGGFVVGSEMSGNVRNIKVSHCSFLGTDVGLRFKSTRGRGGVVENIYIENITMTNIPTDPLLFDLFYGGRGPTEDDYSEVQESSSVIPPVTIETPVFRNIFIKNIVSNNSKRAMYFNGLPEMKVDNVLIENSVFKSNQGAIINQTSNIIMKDIKIDHSEGEILQLQNVDNGLFKNITNSKGETKTILQEGQNNKIVIE